MSAQAAAASGDWIQISGESMRPLLRSEEWVSVEWYAQDQRAPQARLGDVLLARRATESFWLVHRLVDADHGGSYTLKGDASMQSEHLDRTEIWGRVVAVRSRVESPPTPLNTGGLDRLIALLSRLRLRRTVYVLSAWRRRQLDI